jgi:hypothetical protein
MTTNEPVTAAEMQIHLNKQSERFQADVTECAERIKHYVNRYGNAGVYAVAYVCVLVQEAELAERAGKAKVRPLSDAMRIESKIAYTDKQVPDITLIRGTDENDEAWAARIAETKRQLGHEVG